MANEPAAAKAIPARGDLVEFAIATDGGSVLFVFKDETGGEFRVVRDEAMGSATVGRFFLAGASSPLDRGGEKSLLKLFENCSVQAPDTEYGCRLVADAIALLQQQCSS